MTQKDFIAFAKYISNLNPKQFGRGEREDMANMVIAVQDNPNFNKEKFLKAAGWTEFNLKNQNMKYKDMSEWFEANDKAGEYNNFQLIEGVECDCNREDMKKENPQGVLAETQEGTYWVWKD